MRSPKKKASKRDQTDKNSFLSHNYFQNFIDANIVGVVIADPAGSIIETNDYYLRLIGYTRKEFEQGMVNWRAITPPEWLNADEKAVRELRKTGKCTPYEKEYLRRDGTRVSVYLSDAMLPGPEEHIAAFVIDITERKRMEKALQASEERLNRALENIPDVVVIYDNDLKIQYINAATRRITGRPISDYIGKREEEIWPPEVYRVYLPMLQESLNTGEVRSVETDLALPKSGIRNLKITCIPLKDERGNVREVMGITNDFTELIQREAALKDTEDKFRYIFEAANVGKSITLPDGEIYVNNAFAAMLGYSREELTNKTWQDLTPSEDIENIQMILNSLLKGEKDTARFDKRYIQKDGFYKWADVNLAIRRSNDGKPLHFITTIVDISERRLAEEQLRISEERFSNAFHVSPAGMTITRIADGTFIDANESFLRLFDFSRDEVIGHTSVELNMWSLEERDALIRKLVESGGLQNYELQARSKSGKIINILFSSKPMELQGETCHMMTMIDITERKQAETALQESEERFRTIVEGAPEPMFIHVDRKFVYLNPAALRLFGAEKQEDLAGKPVKERLHPAFQEIVQQRQHVVSDERKPVGDLLDLIFFKLDGTEVWAETSGEPIVYDGRNGALVFARDITERKRTEEALRESERKFRNTIVNLDEGYYSVTPDGILLEHNRAFSRILGFDEDADLKGIRLPDFWQNTDGRTAYLEALTATGQISNYQIRAKKKTGEKITAIAGAHLIMDRDGRPERIDGVFLDISERIKAEEELLESRQKLSDALDMARLGYWELDTGEGVFTFSDSFYRIFHTNAKDMGGYKMSIDEYASRFVHPEDYPKVAEETLKAIETDDPNYNRYLEHRMLYVDGGMGYIAVKIFLIKDSSGKTVKTYGINQDITERRNAERAIRESEERFRMIFENNLDAFFLAEPDGKILMVNPAGCRMFGRSEKEICELGINSLVNSTGPMLNPGLEKRAKTGHFNGELTGIRANGERFPAEVTSVLFTDSDNKILASIIVHDINERKKAEENIKKLNRIYAVLSEINKSIVRIKDQQQLFEETCRIAVEIGEFRLCWIGIMDTESGYVIPIAQHGFSDGYLENIKISISGDKKEGRGPTGTALREGKYNICNDIENDERMLPWHEQALKRGYRSSTAFPLVRSGDVFGAINFYSSQPGFFNEEEVKLLEELSSDISYCVDTIERERQKQLIEKERDRLFNYSIDMMCVAGFDGYFRQLNPAWERTLGWTIDELMSKPYIEFVHPEDRENTVATTKELSEKKQIIYNFVNRFICRDGTYKWLSWNSVPLTEEGLIFAVTRDHTTQVNNENERKNLETQLVQAQKLESLGTLAGGIAHDFNNILNIIMGYASILESGDFDEDELPDFVKIIMDASMRGADLIKQLLTFARKTETIFKPVQINDIIIEIKKLLAETFPKTIKISLNLHSQLPLIIADASQIHQVFMNLCVNARDAMQNNGILSIYTKRLHSDDLKIQNPAVVAGEYIEIKVSDTGTGMDEITKKRIFEPFFTTKETGKGTGLGLALAYAIIQNHGGFIDVESEVGKGTSFYIYMPALERISDVFQPLAKITETDFKGFGTILLIEDERQHSELLATILVLKGFKVISAYDGLQGILEYRNHMKEITVVISDIGLPQLGGEEVFKQIKKLNPEAKIILISGFIDPEMKARLFEAGARHIIQKPYMPDKILRVIKDVIEEKI